MCFSSLVHCVFMFVLSNYTGNPTRPALSDLHKPAQASPAPPSPPSAHAQAHANFPCLRPTIQARTTAIDLHLTVETCAAQAPRLHRAGYISANALHYLVGNAQGNLAEAPRPPSYKFLNHRWMRDRPVLAQPPPAQAMNIVRVIIQDLNGGAPADAPAAAEAEDCE